MLQMEAFRSQEFQTQHLPPRACRDVFAHAHALKQTMSFFAKRMDANSVLETNMVFAFQKTRIIVFLLCFSYLGHPASKNPTLQKRIRRREPWRNLPAATRLDFQARGEAATAELPRRKNTFTNNKKNPQLPLTKQRNIERMNSKTPVFFVLNKE